MVNSHGKQENPVLSATAALVGHEKGVIFIWQAEAIVKKYLFGY